MEGRRREVGVHVCPCMCSYIYVHMHTYIHTYIHTYKEVCMERRWREVGGKCRKLVEQTCPGVCLHMPWAHLVE